MCVRVRVVNAPSASCALPTQHDDAGYVLDVSVLKVTSTRLLYCYFFCYYWLLVCLFVDSAEVSTIKPLIDAASWSTNSVCHVTISHASAACLKFYSWSRDENEKSLCNCWLCRLKLDNEIVLLYSLSLLCTWYMCSLHFLGVWPGPTFFYVIFNCMRL